MKIKSKYRFKSEYTSPFGEYWSVYRLWFGFIPIQDHVKVFNDMYDISLIENHVKELNKETVEEIRDRRINKILK